MSNNRGIKRITPEDGWCVDCQNLQRTECDRHRIVRWKDFLPNIYKEEDSLVEMINLMLAYLKDKSKFLTKHQLHSKDMKKVANYIKKEREKYLVWSNEIKELQKCHSEITARFSEKLTSSQIKQYNKLLSDSKNLIKEKIKIISQEENLPDMLDIDPRYKEEVKIGLDALKKELMDNLNKFKPRNVLDMPKGINNIGNSCRF